MSDVKLADLRDVAVSCRENSMHFEGFRQNALVSSLGWPDDVVEQFLYDHADNIGFLRDYGDLDRVRLLARCDISGCSGHAVSLRSGMLAGL
jgi:hypothetical protein